MPAYNLITEPANSVATYGSSNVGFARRTALSLVACFLAGLTASSAVAVDSDGDSVDDALIVSVAEDGDQSFPDTDAGETDTVADISFAALGSPCSTTAFTNGSAISARNIMTGNSVNIGSGSGTLNCASANIYGGAGGTGFYVAPGNTEAQAWTLSFTNTQRYLGFWWSAGNDGNTVQLLDQNDNVLLDPVFDSVSLYETLFNSPTRDCIVNNVVNDYCGNPNLVIAGTSYNSRQVPSEPYAFIHMRYETGFQKVRFWGPGFEIDNVTFSETVPTFGATEAVVGNPDVDSNWPDVLVLDPRSTGVLMPALLLSNSNNATICLSEVDSNGNTLGTPSIQVTRDSNIGGVTAHTPETNRWGYSGARAQVQDQIPLLRIESSNSGNPVLASGSTRIRMVLTNGTTLASCDTPQVSQTIELRALSFTGRKEFGVGP